MFQGFKDPGGDLKKTLSCVWGIQEKRKGKIQSHDRMRED